MDQPDPARTFIQDQEAAKRQEETREEAAWTLNIRNGEAQAADQEAHAAHLQAKAAFWKSLADLIYVSLGMAMVVFVIAAIVLLVGAL